MANLTETQDAYDRHNLHVVVIHSDVADVILKLEAERDALRAALIRWLQADETPDFMDADEALAALARSLLPAETEPTP